MRSTKSEIKSTAQQQSATHNNIPGGIGMVITVCAYCSKVKRTDSKWETHSATQEVPKIVLERCDDRLLAKIKEAFIAHAESARLSHGHCPPCHVKAMDALQEESGD